MPNPLKAITTTNHQKTKSFAFSLIILILILLTIRVLMPYTVGWYVNRAIEKAPAISGAIGDVDIALIKGAYSIENINIKQQGDDESYPFIKVERLNLSLLWSALFEGKLVTEIELINPVLSLYDRPENDVIESKEVLNEKTWIGLAKDLTPFSIDSLVIKNGTFEIDAKNALKKSRFALESINAKASNFSNNSNNKSLADIHLTGKIQNYAELSVKSQFNPNSAKPTIDINLEMARLPLSYIDELVKFYAPFDFEAGEVDLAMELKALEGVVEGYVKFGVYDIDVFSWHEDVVEDNDNPLRLLIESIGGLFSSLVESSEKDLVATKVPISGTLNNPDISALQAFLGILRNAFVETYNMNVENSIPGLTQNTEDKDKDKDKDKDEDKDKVIKE